MHTADCPLWIVSCANSASMSLVQWSDNTGQNIKPMQDLLSNPTLPNKSGDECLLSVSNVQHNILTRERGRKREREREREQGWWIKFKSWTFDFLGVLGNSITLLLAVMRTNHFTLSLCELCLLQTTQTSFHGFRQLNHNWCPDIP